ncbi:ribonuclease P protein subunit [Candidatus Woesearchaeota archaeon]|nr:ribonuclease P protein subunit [Candidatus Woesearchaeota archaeon]
MVTLKKQIVAGEYIGKKVAVFSKKNDKQLSQGVIVDETKNTFALKEDDKKDYQRKVGRYKKIIKKDVYFVANFGSKKIKVDGLLLAKRSEDRIKIKI